MINKKQQKIIVGHDGRVFTIPTVELVCKGKT